MSWCVKAGGCAPSTLVAGLWSGGRGQSGEIVLYTSQALNRISDETLRAPLISIRKWMCRLSSAPEGVDKLMANNGGDPRPTWSIHRGA